MVDPEGVLWVQLNPPLRHKWVGGLSNYSRLVLFRLSEVRPPRYTGHLAWHGMIAIIMFTAQNSPWSTATRYSVYRPVLAVPNKVFNVILYVYYGWIWRFGCGLANKIGLHLNRKQNDSLSYIILETRTAKVVIRFEVRSFLSRGYFLSCSHLRPSCMAPRVTGLTRVYCIYIVS